VVDFNSGEIDAYIPYKHHLLARLIALGFSYREAAERLGLSEGRVRAIASSPLFKKVTKDLLVEMDQSVKKAQNILVEASPKAAETIVDIMEKSNSERLRKEAAMDVLRGANVVKNEGAKPQIIINISDSKLSLIQQTIKEMKEWEAKNGR